MGVAARAWHARGCCDLPAYSLVLRAARFPYICQALASACGDRATISKAMSKILLSVAQQPDSARQSAAFWAG
eukprot:586886-Pleurochrysis_carterae.AAC.1